MSDPRRLRFAAGLGAILAFTSCAAPPPEAPMRAWVGVYDANELGPSEDLSLEIGATAWRIEAGNGGGVATPMLDAPATVMLVAVDSCRTLASFEARPGSAHRIRIDGASVAVEDATGSALEMGPGLVEGQPSGCGSASEN